MKLPVTLPASLAALNVLWRGSSIVLGNEVWRRGCMRARLGFVLLLPLPLPLLPAPGWWEEDMEVMERFRGFGGGGEDIAML